MCTKGETFAHMNCQGQPLREYVLLGQVVHIRSRKNLAVVNCCQPGSGCGGTPMDMDHEHNIFNDHGPACTSCTDAIVRDHHAQHRQLYPFLASPREFKCCLCDHPLHQKNP